MPISPTTSTGTGDCPLIRSRRSKSTTRRLTCSRPPSATTQIPIALRSLAWSYIYLGRAYARTGSAKEAAASFQEAHTLLGGLSPQLTPDIATKFGLACVMADLANQENNPTALAHALQSAVDSLPPTRMGDAKNDNLPETTDLDLLTEIESILKALGSAEEARAAKLSQRIAEIRGSIRDAVIQDWAEYCPRPQEVDRKNRDSTIKSTSRPGEVIET